MVETTSSFGAVARGTGPKFLEFFSQADLSVINSFEPVVKLKRGNDLVSNFSGKTGSGYLDRTADGSSVSDGSRYKLYNTAITQEPYTKRLTVTRQALLYRDFSGEFDESKDLINTFKQSLTRAAAAIFNRAFTSGAGVTAGIRVVPYGDGSPLCSTSHPRVDGGAAQSNASASGIPLSENNVETGMIALLNQVADDGVPLVEPGKIVLVVGQNNRKTAMILAKSLDRPGTANNDTNIYKDGYLDVLVSSHLDLGISAPSVGSNTQWFLVAPERAKLCIVLSKGPDLDISKHQDTKSGLFDILADIGIGFYDWRGVWGSLGNNAAYSS